MHKTSKLSTYDIQTGSGNALFEQLYKKSKLSTEDIRTGFETFLFGSFPTPQSNRAFSSFSVSDTGEVLNNENLMKLNTLSPQTNDEITKELPECPNLRTNQKNLIFSQKFHKKTLY